MPFVTEVGATQRIYERIVVNRILHFYLATYRRPVFAGAVFTNAQASIRGAAAISW
jgi:hypothetical protein